jgi:cellulose synthase/poly-beta-1,6-N-acetylglucosamine synthase-like glycosyltransferase
MRAGEPPAGELPDCAIVVTARNEEAQLPALLTSLDSQDYPSDLLQIAVVNDGSSDGTALVMDTFKPARHHFQMIHIEDHHGLKATKKSAITAGINSTSAPLLILTDADTAPPPGWIRTMASALEGGCPVVAGYSPATDSRSLMGWLACMWDLHSASLAAGFIGLGLPLHITGRNWGFCRQLFNRTGGYSGFERVISGDDTLLVQRFASESNARNWGFTFSRQSQVPTSAPLSLFEFIRQKQRHLATAKRFKPAQFAIAMLSFCIFTAFWLGFLILPFRMQSSTIVAALGLKIASDTAFLLYAGRLSGDLKITVSTPLWSMVHLFIYPLLQLLATFVPFKWKGRKGI